MDFIDEINRAGIACLIAESEVTMQRMMGGFGSRKKKAVETYEAALRHLFDTLRSSGYTVDELAALRNENGRPPFDYGVIEILKRESGKY